LPLKKRVLWQSLPPLTQGLLGWTKKTSPNVKARYLYQPGELEGGTKRATDPVWSLKVYTLEKAVDKPGEPVLYYLHDGPMRGFFREELLIVPPNTQLLSAQAM